MKKTKTQKGITLIALIITIVVLLILAVVAISSIQNDGILSYANNAAIAYNQAQKNEQDILDGYLSYMPGNGGGASSAAEIELTEAQTDTMLTKTTNSVTSDEYGNKIVVPAGFKITTDASNVTEGMVIEDEDGNQFVWIPVGNIKTSTTDTVGTTIELNRYSFEQEDSNGNSMGATIGDDEEPIAKGDGLVGNFYQEQKTSTNGIASAKDIEAFKTSVAKNGGYYFARFNAGDVVSTSANTARTESTSDENAVICKANQQVYNYVTQPQASSLSQGMYLGATTFVSDLSNSYALDTATVFVRKFKENTGTDTICNIYDMTRGDHVWTTEITTDSSSPCVAVGLNGITNNRVGVGDATVEAVGIYFRPILYIV